MASRHTELLTASLADQIRDRGVVLKDAHMTVPGPVCVSFATVKDLPKGT